MVLHEEVFYLSFALRHIPYIHTNYDLLNPFWQQIYKKLISFSSYSFANWIIAIIFALEKNRKNHKYYFGFYGIHLTYNNRLCYIVYVSCPMR